MSYFCAAFGIFTESQKNTVRDCRSVVWNVNKYEQLGTFRRFYNDNYIDFKSLIETQLINLIKKNVPKISGLEPPQPTTQFNTSLTHTTRIRPVNLFVRF